MIVLTEWDHGRRLHVPAEVVRVVQVLPAEVDTRRRPPLEYGQRTLVEIDNVQHLVRETPAEIEALKLASHEKHERDSDG